ncbi:MAG TPA: hypothetical protein VGM39_03700 [Kofleriaceae bacterium]
MVNHQRALGMRFYFDPSVDARPHVLAIRAALPRPQPLTTIEYLHRKNAATTPLTNAAEAQLADWLTGPWRQDAWHVLLHDGSANTFGIDIHKPTDDPREMGLLYTSWPIEWALEHLDELERAFLDVCQIAPVYTAQAGAMLVESPFWPVGESLASTKEPATRESLAHSEWGVLHAASARGLSDVSWWTFLGPEIAADSIQAERTVQARGRAYRASPSPIGPDAQRGQAALFAQLEALIAPVALAQTFNSDITRVARHDQRGRLRRMLDLAQELSDAGLRRSGTWEQSLARYYTAGNELRALGLPEVDVCGRPTRVHPRELFSLLPTLLHNAPALPLADLTARYAQAWAALADHRDIHGVPFRVRLLADRKHLGPPSRKQSWRDAERYPRIQLVGALPALFEAGGVAAVTPYFAEAARLADAFPVLHHALARIYGQSGDRSRAQHHVDAAARAGYERAEDLAVDEIVGLVQPAEVSAPTGFEPARVVFAGPSMVLVNHETRGRFTFHCAGSGCAKGATVRLSGFDGVKARYLELPDGRVFAEW